MTTDGSKAAKNKPRRGVARLADVAARAGVGTSIASRVLNNDPTVGVRPETRERILAAATELQYRPNAAARGLKSQRTTTIGLVIPNLAYPVNSEIIHGAERAASEAGYVLLIADGEEFMQAGQAYHRLLLEGRVDGLMIASASTSEPMLRDIISTDLPLILVNRRAGSVAPSVTVDDALGMRLAVEHLIELGHTSIGYVSGPRDADTAQRRLEGFLAAREGCGSGRAPRSYRRVAVRRSGRIRRMRGAAQRWPKRPTAVTVWSVAAAIGVLAALANSGFRVPADVSVVAFHDVPLAAYVQPPLTTVRMPLAEMAELGVRALLKRIAGSRSRARSFRPGRRSSCASRPALRAET